MTTWQIIRNLKISEGFSEDAAYKIASDEMEKRRNAFDPATILGMDEVIAKSILDQNGYSLRVISRDGIGMAVNLDWRVTRCNVRVVKGIVTQIVGMG